MLQISLRFSRDISFVMVISLLANLGRPIVLPTDRNLYCIPEELYPSLTALNTIRSALAFPRDFLKALYRTNGPLCDTSTSAKGNDTFLGVNGFSEWRRNNSHSNQTILEENGLARLLSFEAFYIKIF